MDTQIKNNQKFKIKYTKQDGEEVRRFGILTEDCRGFGNRQKDNRPFLHYYDLDKKGFRYATNWEILWNYQSSWIKRLPKKISCEY